MIFEGPEPRADRPWLVLCKGRKEGKKGGIKIRKGGRYKVRKAKKKREEGEREYSEWVLVGEWKEK